MRVLSLWPTDRRCPLCFYWPHYHQSRKAYSRSGGQRLWLCRCKAPSKHNRHKQAQKQRGLFRWLCAHGLSIEMAEISTFNRNGHLRYTNTTLNAWWLCIDEVAMIFYFILFFYYYQICFCHCIFTTWSITY